jgi:hypothetical protein
MARRLAIDKRAAERQSRCMTLRSDLEPRQGCHQAGWRHALLLCLTGLSLASSTRADTSLTVDLGSTIRPVTHAASGSLYGVTEKVPADASAMIMPLHPNMFINPAANVQQPVGDAIAVAARVAPLGARVTIRLADWFPSWPYAFTNMNDWFDKVGQTVSRKKASGLDNYYGYEIWNEPDGTWKSSMAFTDFWKQSHTKLRALDAGAKLIGPSIAWYDGNYLRSFLAFAKSNGCLPDIVSWHELNGSNLTANFQNYRSLEKQLGIGPLPISINEYSGKDRINDEGKPGASAPMIAKFERFEVDSACISYWDVPHPGRLGSLLASDTATNGGWWFYKWYGDMSGNMVSTIAPAPNDATALDGFANVDATAKTASVLFAGINDGKIQIVIKGFGAAPFFGSKVHVVVEHTRFVNRTTATKAVDTISMADATVTNNQITVSLSNTNSEDGYRVSLSPVDGGGGSRVDAGSGGEATGNGASGVGGVGGVGGTRGAGRMQAGVGAAGSAAVMGRGEALGAGRSTTGDGAAGVGMGASTIGSSGSTGSGSVAGTSALAGSVGQRSGGGCDLTAARADHHARPGLLLLAVLAVWSRRHNRSRRRPRFHHVQRASYRTLVTVAHGFAPV